MTKSTLANLRFIFYQSGGPELTVTRKDNLVTRIILYLHTYYYKKLTVGEITRKFATNCTTLSHKFKQAVNESLVPYLNKIRLRNTAWPVQ